MNGLQELVRRPRRSILDQVQEPRPFAHVPVPTMGSRPFSDPASRDEIIRVNMPVCMRASHARKLIRGEGVVFYLAPAGCR